MKLITRRSVYILLQIFLTLAVQAFSLDQYKKISSNGKFGLADAATDEVIIDPVYDDIGWSNQDLSVIDGKIGFKEKELWGLIDLEGQKVFSTQFTAIYPFSKNLLIVGQRSRFSILNRYAVFNTKGKKVLDFEFSSLLPAGEHLIAVKRSNNRTSAGLIAANGKEVIPFNYRSIEATNENLLAVESYGGLKAIFTNQGDQKTGFEFESITTFDQDNFLVSLHNRQGIVNGNGDVIIKPIYKKINLLDGKYTASSFSKWTLLDSENRLESEFYFDNITPVSESIYAVKIDGNLGLIDPNGSYLDYFQDLNLISAHHEKILVKDDRYFGVRDHLGKVILPLQFDSVWVNDDLNFGQIKRANNHSWTPYDNEGKKVGYFEYEFFEQENPKRLRARRNGKWGLLDLKGNEVSPFLYDSLGPLQNGIAKVSYLNNYGVISEDGLWLVTPYKDRITITESNIVYEQGSEHGIMDLKGNVLYRSRSEIEPIGDLFQVKLENGSTALLNELGNRAVLEPVDTVFHIEPALYVYRQDDRWKIFNNTSKAVAQLRKDIQQIDGFEEDLISVKIDDQWGYIDENGRLSIANRYDSVQHFSEGLSAIKLIGHWGFINRQERLVIQPNYDEVEAFYGQLSKVRNGDRYGLINKTGKEIVSIKFDKIERFNDYFLLHENGSIGFADRQGTVLRDPQFESVEQVSRTQFLVSKNGKFGVISIKGIDLIPVIYDKVVPFNNKYLVKENAGQPERLN